MARNILQQAVLWPGIFCELVTFVSGLLRLISRPVETVVSIEEHKFQQKDGSEDQRPKRDLGIDQ